MDGDHDSVVADVQQTVTQLNGHGFSGEMAPDVIAVLEDADAPRAIDVARDRRAAITVERDANWQKRGFGQ